MLYLSSHSAGGVPGTELLQVAISVKEDPYNATGLGIVDDAPAIRAALAAAVAEGRPLYFPPGTYLIARDGGNNWSLLLSGLSNVQVFGEPGLSILKHPDNAAGSGSSLQMVTVRGCTNIEFSGLTFDGNWGNSIVYLRAEITSGFQTYVDLAALPGNELLYEGDGSNFPTSGSVTVVTKDSAQVLTYTGKTSNKFTGVSAGTGILKAGDPIGKIDKRQGSTTITAGSNGLSLPQATINVGSTTKFPTSVAGSKIVQIFTTNGWESITYTGKTGTTLTGCAGGTGTLTTGDSVIYVDGAGNQIDAPPQGDPKNHLVFVYGSDGNSRLPNNGILFRNCEFRDSYGDNIWIGAWSDDVRLENCLGNISARNGVTMSSFTSGVKLSGSKFYNAFTSALDSEPESGPVQGLTIDNCDFGTWFNPHHDPSGGVTMSLQGGTVGRPAEWNYISNVRVSNSRVRGSVYVTDARDVVISANELTCDYQQTSLAPIVVDMFCEGIVIDNNDIYSSMIPANLYNYGAVCVSGRRTHVNAAAQPANVKVSNNRIHARNGIIGVYSEITGGYSGFEGTATGYTAPAGPSTLGAIEVAGTPWTGSIDYWAGHQVLMGGKLANIVGNDANTLLIAPLYENYSSGLAWSDRRGRPVPAPTAGAFKIFATGGRVTIENNTIDCRNRDGEGAGGYGISVDNNGPWDPGFNDGRIVIRGNDIRGATGRAINVRIQTGTTSFKEVQVVGNHAWDDQTPPTCTSHVYFTNAEDITTRVLHSNTQEGAITPVVGLTNGVWRQSDSYPEAWAGYEDPNGLIAAVPGSTYSYIPAAAVLIKETNETFNTGWNPFSNALFANVRSIGQPVFGGGALDFTAPGVMPASVNGDIELLFISTNHTGAPGADATLSTPAGFVKKVSNTSTFGANVIVNRGAVWWRRKRPGDVPPVVADSGDHNEALIIAVKDVIGFGDPFDFNPVVNANNAASSPANVTALGGTTISDGALFFNLATWFSSGPTNNIGSWVNADTDLTAASEIVDAGVTAAFEKIGIGLYQGRVETAAAIGNTTATINAENYAVWTAITFALKPAVASARASGLITCTTKANYVDTDYLTLGDGFTLPREFEFDTAGNGVTAGRVQVNISTDTTAAQVAARLRTAILATFAGLDVVDNGDGTLTLSNRWPGSGGNVAMSENVANAGHTVSGMTGGQG